MIKTCPKCRSKIHGEASICPRCGTTFTSEEMGAGVREARSDWTVRIAVRAAILIAVAGLVLYWLYGGGLDQLANAVVGNTKP